jgi:hypothetical protein
MIELRFEQQLAVSTAEDEHNYFTGQPEVPVRPNPNGILPAGTYRVIDGALYRVVGGTPSKLFVTESKPDNSDDTVECP